MNTEIKYLMDKIAETSVQLQRLEENIIKIAAILETNGPKSFEYVTREQAAKHLGMSKASIDKYTRDGILEKGPAGKILWKSLLKLKEGKQSKESVI